MTRADLRDTPSSFGVNLTLNCGVILSGITLHWPDIVCNAR
jgi:hypothetical protein